MTEREDYWIKKLKSYENEFGYNIAEATNATYGMLNKKHKKETIEKMKIINKKENNPMYGKKLSKEHRRKIGMHFRGITLEEEHKRKIGESNRKFINIKIYYKGKYITTKRTVEEAAEFVRENYGYKITTRNLIAKMKAGEEYRRKITFECDIIKKKRAN
ncbi:GIY-YIG nuclease family protein [Geobacillus phage GR1]|nr:GIY-YIG nuclease family protein [Geobacillus phage GR1]